VPDDVANPAFINMFDACYYLKQADENFDSAESIVAASDPTFSLDRQLACTNGHLVGI
jgi:hypothetical protein